MRSRSASSSARPSRRRTNRTTRTSRSHVLADGDALEHFVDLLDLAIDLGGADAHAARVQHGVRAAVDDEAVVLRQLGIVAVTPHAGKALEVGRAILRAVGDRSRTRSASRETAARNQLALSRARAAVFVEDLDRHAEAAALHFAATDRQQRIAEREAGNDVGAAGDRREADVRLDVA